MKSESATDVKLTVFFHPDVLLHDTGAGLFEKTGSPLMTVQENHPEGPDRIRNIFSILKRGPICENIEWQWGRYAEREEILYFHTADYLDSVINADRNGPSRLTETTIVGRGSYKAFLAAVGTSLSAMSYVLGGKNRIAYSLIRPCGHHASPNTADGYCIFNNAAIAAELAITSGAKRVAIIDWDVHHGNGTQSGFYDRNDILTVSLHMDHGPWGLSHPETGQIEEIGEGIGKGYNLNISLPMGTGDLGYNLALNDIVVPKIHSFKPDVIIVACGQDASQFDANGRQMLTMDGFRQMGKTMRGLANTFTGGSLLLVQEGGYAISYAPFCLYATIEGVLGIESNIKDPLGFLPENLISATLAINKMKEFSLHQF